MDDEAGFGWWHGWDDDWIDYPLQPEFDDDQLIEELDNEVVEEVEEEWGAWLSDGERPIANTGEL